MLYLSRYSNVYLHSTAETFWEFVKPDLTLGLSMRPENADALSAIAKWLGNLRLEPPRQFGTMAVIVSSLIVAAFNFVLPSIVLRNCARDGADALKAHVASGASHGGMSEAAITASLAQMVFWPTSYVSSAATWLLAVFASFSLVIYQLGPLILGVTLMAVVARVAVAAAFSLK
jgi:hypothetical protein